MDRGRLQRGRRYARKGQVLSLTEGKGQVTGKVQGSRKRPYTVTISIQKMIKYPSIIFRKSPTPLKIIAKDYTL